MTNSEIIEQILPEVKRTLFSKYSPELFDFFYDINDDEFVVNMNDEKIYYSEEY